MYIEKTFLLFSFSPDCTVNIYIVQNGALTSKEKNHFHLPKCCDLHIPPLRSIATYRKCNILVRGT